MPLFLQEKENQVKNPSFFSFKNLDTSNKFRFCNLQESQWLLASLVPGGWGAFICGALEMIFQF